VTAFIKSLIKRPCYKVSSSSTLVEVIEVLSRHNIGAVLVVDESNSVEGIISERDIVRQLLIDQIVNGLVASDIMTKNVISVTPNVSSSEIMKLMTENKCRHLPIVSNGQLLGVVSIGDVVKRLLEKYDQELEQMRTFINA
jgi:CBS domain-containing protein